MNRNVSAANLIGEITQTERKTAGKAAFGFDPIFQPAGTRKTFAEMTIEEKNGFSHRAKAIENLQNGTKPKDCHVA